MPAPAANRTKVLVVAICVAFAVVGWRLIQLQVLRHEELAEKAEDYRFTSHTEQAWRGQLRDRNGRTLAITVPTKNIYADLAVWTNRVDQLARIIAPKLALEPRALSQRVNEALGRRMNTDGSVSGAVLLKRGVAPEEWAKVKESLAREHFGLPSSNPTSRQRAQLKRLRRWCLFAEDDQSREYLFGDSLSHLLGFVGRGDNGHSLQGKWGIEATVDSLLAGTNGGFVSNRDGAGNELIFCRTDQTTAQDGTHVTLSVDIGFQRMVEQALAGSMRHSPRSVSCVVVRPSTGEILALANLPAFPPQAPASAPPAAWRNHAVSDQHEVGSVFKVFTLAAALELGAVQLDQSVNCENGLWQHGGLSLRDDGHRNGWLTVRECLAKSSNIGFGKIALQIGPERLHDFIMRFGFGRTTGVPLPDEARGLIRKPKDWSKVSITRIAIGHELLASQMQLVMAYAAIANDGVLMRPQLVTQLNHSDGTFWGRYPPQAVGTVIRPETARQVRAAMRDVVERGTGKAAALPDHSVAGKTGTAQKVIGGRYISGRVYSSFVGMVPADKPELVIAVAVDDPQDSAYGGVAAAPVFREIAAQAVEHFQIPPDKSRLTARTER